MYLGMYIDSKAAVYTQLPLPVNALPPESWNYQQE